MVQVILLYTVNKIAIDVFELENCQKFMTNHIKHWSMISADKRACLRCTTPSKRCRRDEPSDGCLIASNTTDKANDPMVDSAIID